MKINSDLKKIKEIITLLEKGNLQDILKTEFTKEQIKQGDSYKLFKACTDIEKKIQLLKSVIYGGSIDDHDLEGDDELSLAILEIHKHLQDVERKNKTTQRDLELERKKLIQEDWIKSQVSNLFSNIQGVRTMKELGDILLNTISNSIGAQVSALYCRDSLGSKGEDFSKLQIISSYGFNPLSVKQEFVLGEGMIGQCALDKKIRHITDLPASFQKIETGIGEVPPACAYIAPIIYEDVVYGVIEFVSIRQFKDLEIRFLNRVNRSIGINMKSIMSFMYSEQLMVEIAKTNNSLASQKDALDSAAIVAETDLRGKITYVNQKFVEISKYSREDLIGQDHRILNSKFHSKDFFVNLWRTISHGDIWHGEVRNRAKDGSIYWVDTTIYPVKDENGRLQKFVAIRFDITGKKQALEALQQATESARIAAAVKTEFLANMSHEIRTPMNAIVGMTDILKETMLNSDQQRYVNVMGHASEALLDIINSILDISKLESGNVSIEDINFDLEELVETTCGIMSTPAQKKQLEFNNYIATNLPEKVSGDPGKIRQVLINLIGNATKFTKTGEIYVSLEKVNENPLCVEFSVRDTGIGIPADRHEKLFKNFSQVSNSTSREYGGTGLGLAISKKLVEAMGGTIGVESEENVGSRFFFRIPMHVQSGIKTISEKSKEFKWPSEVFLVDSDSRSRNNISQFLSEQNVEVICMDKMSQLNEKSTIYPQCKTLISCVTNDQDELLQTEFLKKKNFKKMILIYNSAEQTFFKPTSILNTQIVYLNKPYRRIDLAKAITDVSGVNDAHGLVEKSISAAQLLNEKSEKIVNVEVKSKDALKILIADDVQTNLDIVKVYLQDLPVQLDFAKNGEEALSLYNLNKYDLILMDIQMPIMDGRQATQKIRGLEKERNLSPVNIVALSAHATNEEIKQSLNVGCNGHLSKPIRKKALIEAIQSYTHKVAG